MREIWGPAWFATALCAIAIVALLLGRLEAAAPAFPSFLPVVFFQMSRTIQTLSNRIEELEHPDRGERATKLLIGTPAARRAAGV